MSDSKLVTKEVLEKAFSLMGTYLRERKVIGEIAIYGGAAIMLQYDWRKATRDVDALIKGGNHSLVVSAVKDTARKLNLPDSWLNENVSIYRSSKESDTDLIPFGMYPSYETPGLRVLSARPEYLLAMKIVAMERTTVDNRDFEDAANIGAETQIENEEQLRDLVRQYFGEEGLPAEVETQLPDLVNAITSARNAGRLAP